MSDYAALYSPLLQVWTLVQWRLRKRGGIGNYLRSPARSLCRLRNFPHIVYVSALDETREKKERERDRGERERGREGRERQRGRESERERRREKSSASTLRKYGAFPMYGARICTRSFQLARPTHPSFIAQVLWQPMHMVVDCNCRSKIGFGCHFL